MRLLCVSNITTSGSLSLCSFFFVELSPARNKVPTPSTAIVQGMNSVPTMSTGSSALRAIVMIHAPLSNARVQLKRAL